MPELDVHIYAAPAQDTASESQHQTPLIRPERRKERRQREPKQVWIQGTDASGANVEEVQTMKNHSRDGFYFVTSLHCYRVGMQVNVIPSFGALNLEYVAEIVRVEPKPRMAYGVGVKLLHVREPMNPRSSS